MKNYLTVAVALLALPAMAIGEAPSLSLYEFIPSDPDHGLNSGELVLKLDNPTDKPLYIFGLYLTDISYSVEVLKNGKWSSYPIPPGDKVNPAFRKLLPHSYMLVEPFYLPSQDEDWVFRIRAVVHTKAIWSEADKDVNEKPSIELVSPEFATKDLRASEPKAKAAANIPALEPIPKTK